MTDQSRTPSRSFEDVYELQSERIRTLELEAADLRERLAALTAALENKAIMEAERPEPVKTFTCGLCGTAPSVEKSDYDTLLAFADRMAAESAQWETECHNATMSEKVERERAETAERQLAELQAKHDALVRAAETTRPLSALDNAEDAERYRYLQNIAPKDAQAFFWNFNSRRQRSAAIDAARKESHD